MTANTAHTGRQPLNLEAERRIGQRIRVAGRGKAPGVRIIGHNPQPTYLVEDDAGRRYCVPVDENWETVTD